MSSQQQAALRRLSFRVKDLSLIGKLKSSRINFQPSEQQEFQIALPPRSNSIGINTAYISNRKQAAIRVMKKLSQQQEINPQIGKTYINSPFRLKKPTPLSNTGYLIPLKGPFPIAPKKHYKQTAKGNQGSSNSKLKRGSYSNRKNQQILYSNNFNNVSKDVDFRLLQLLKNKSSHLSSPKSSVSKIFQPVTHSRGKNYSPQLIYKKQRSPIAMHKVAQTNQQYNFGSIKKQIYNQQGTNKKKIELQFVDHTSTKDKKAQKSIFNHKKGQDSSMAIVNASERHFKQFLELQNIHPVIIESKKMCIQHQANLMNFDNQSQVDKQKSVYGDQQSIFNYIQSSDPHYQNALQKPKKNRQNIQIALTSFHSHQKKKQQSQQSQTDFTKMKGGELTKQKQISVQPWEKSSTKIGSIARIRNGIHNKLVQQATQTPICMQKEYEKKQLVLLQLLPKEPIQSVQVLTQIQTMQSKLQKSQLYEQKKSQSPELDGSRIQQFPITKKNSIQTIRMNIRQDDEHLSIKQISSDSKKQFGFIYCRSSQFSEELMHNKITLSIGSSISKIKQLLVEAQDSLQITFKIPQVMLLPPSQRDQKKQLHQRMTDIFSYFDIVPQIVTIKKYLNCVMLMLRDRQYCILWYFSGKIYIGKWSFNGKYYYSTTNEDRSDKQEGLIVRKRQDFIEGVKHGLGFQWSPAKYVYFGQYQNNRKQGYGIMKKNTHEVYVGLWADNQRHGWGKLYNQEGNIVHNGQFANNNIQASHLMQEQRALDSKYRSQHPNFESKVQFTFDHSQIVQQNQEQDKCDSQLIQ